MQLFTDPASLSVLVVMRETYPELCIPRNWARFTRTLAALQTGTEACDNADLERVGRCVALFAINVRRLHAEAKAEGANRDVVVPAPADASPTLSVGVVVRVRAGTFHADDASTRHIQREPETASDDTPPASCPECAAPMRVLGYDDVGQVVCEALDAKVRAAWPRFTISTRDVESVDAEATR